MQLVAQGASAISGNNPEAPGCGAWDVTRDDCSGTVLVFGMGDLEGLFQP